MQNSLTACQDAHKPPTRHRLQISQRFQAAYHKPQQRQPENPPNPIFRLPLTIPPNTMPYSTKYSRSLHAPISLGTTSDDRFMPKGYLAAFAAKDALVLTEKLDGQNRRTRRLRPANRCALLRRLGYPQPRRLCHQQRRFARAAQQV